VTKATHSKDSPEVFLSVVIPVYNEAARISGTLLQVAQYLRARREPCELIVVDDGSTDGTGDLLRAMCGDLPEARIISFPNNHGKGFAVRAGMLEAKGEFVLFSDADLSAPIAEVERLLQPLQDGYDVAIGSRALNRDWIEVHQSSLREAAGRLLNRFIRMVTGLPFRDTQCGFKAFRQAAARRIFSIQRIDAFGFDPEILYVARKLGYRTLDVPVHWAHRENSKIRVLRDGLRMALDVMRIRWSDWRGRYSSGRED
jgi:glycosyltransferase involved in cell wall biosynthesis